MKNINPTHADTLKALQLDIAALALEKDSVQVQLDCLAIAKEAHADQKNWLKVGECQNAIARLTKELLNREEMLEIRIKEYNQLQAAAEKENLVEQYLLKNPQLSII